jgi:hypothetical protein
MATDWPAPVELSAESPRSSPAEGRARNGAEGPSACEPAAFVLTLDRAGTIPFLNHAPDGYSVAQALRAREQAAVTQFGLRRKEEPPRWATWSCG